MNNRKQEIKDRLAAISKRTKECFDFEIRNEMYFDVSEVTAERNELYLEEIDLEDELEALDAIPAPPSANRFVKSSFALSLLWVAKFYRSLANSYVAFSARELAAFDLYINSYKAFQMVLGLSCGLFFEYQLPNTFNWLKHS